MQNVTISNRTSKETSMLKLLFNNFASAKIFHRGSDMAVIVSKIIVQFLTLIISLFLKSYVSILLLPIKMSVIIFLLPIIMIILLIGHLSILLNCGIKDDTFEYTIVLEK